MQGSRHRGEDRDSYLEKDLGLSDEKEGNRYRGNSSHPGPF